MLETKTIVVEERHLDAALAAGLNATNKSFDYCSRCLVGQALSEALGTPAAAYRGMVVSYDPSVQWKVIKGEEMYHQLLSVFDFPRVGEDVRTLLPATIVLQREVEG